MSWAARQHACIPNYLSFNFHHLVSPQVYFSVYFGIIVPEFVIHNTSRLPKSLEIERRQGFIINVHTANLV